MIKIYGTKMKPCLTDYLILVNPFHKIPEDYFDGLELVEMRGYDDEVFRVEKEAAQQFCKLQKAAAEIQKLREIQMRQQQAAMEARQAAQEAKAAAEQSAQDAKDEEDAIKSVLKREQLAKPTWVSSDGTERPKPVRKTTKQKVGRNDPCPCGSGKKYKKCCGRNEE